MWQQTLLVRRRKREHPTSAAIHKKESRSRSFSRHASICTVCRFTGTRQAKSIMRYDPLALSIQRFSRANN